LFSDSPARQRGHPVRTLNEIDSGRYVGWLANEILLRFRLDLERNIPVDLALEAAAQHFPPRFQFFQNRVHQFLARLPDGFLRTSDR